MLIVSRIQVKIIISPLLKKTALPKRPYGPVVAAVVSVCKGFHGTTTGLQRSAFILSAELSASVPRAFTHGPANCSDRDSDVCCLLPVPFPAVLLPKRNGSVLQPVTNPAYFCALHTCSGSRQALASVSGYRNSALCSWD